MPRGEKSTYTDKQQRQAEHIEEGYERRGTPRDEAERRAWATVNKIHGGGEKPGGSVDGALQSATTAAARRTSTRTASSPATAGN